MKRANQSCLLLPTLALLAPVLLAACGSLDIARLEEKGMVERLIDALDDDLDVAIAAADALGRLGAPTALGPLFNRTVAGVPQPLVLAAIEALGAYGNPDAATRLINVMASKCMCQLKHKTGKA